MSNLKNQDPEIYLNSVVPAVSHNYVALIINSDPVGSRELAILGAFRPKKLENDIIKSDC